MFSIQKNVFVAAPIEAVSAFLATPENLAKIDRKVKSLTVVECTTPDQAKLELKGVFAGFLPYKLQLDLRYKDDGGFVAKGRAGLLKDFSTAFDLATESGGTRVTHIESYAFYLEPLFRAHFSREVATIVDEELVRLTRYVQEGAHIDLPW